MNSNEALERISIWLIPCDEHKSLLSKTIIDLSYELESPVFDPHVSVFSGETSFDLAQQGLDNAANHFKEIHLETITIRTEPIFTKTLYISLKETNYLSRFSRSFSAYFPAPSFSLDPHLSLAYKKLPKLARESLLRETTMTIRKIRFSCVRAIHTPVPTISENDVEKWKVIYSKKLNRTLQT